MWRGEYCRANRKNTTADYHSVNIADLNRINALSYGTHHIRLKQNSNNTSTIILVADPTCITFLFSINGPQGQPITINKPISLDFTPCNYGGQRKWFICDCGKRVGRLFIHKRQIACRHCFDLVYPSQREDELCRAGRRIDKLEAKLKGQTFRPKGMHHKTFERLTEKIINAEVEREGLFMRIANERFKL